MVKAVGLLTKTGAIDAGIERVTAYRRARRADDTNTDGTVAAGGTVYGMAKSHSHSIRFLPIMMAAHDPLVAAAAVLPLAKLRCWFYSYS